MVLLQRHKSNASVNELSFRKRPVWADQDSDKSLKGFIQQHQVLIVIAHWHYAFEGGPSHTRTEKRAPRKYLQGSARLTTEGFWKQIVANEGRLAGLPEDGAKKGNQPYERQDWMFGVAGWFDVQISQFRLEQH